MRICISCLVLLLCAGQAVHAADLRCQGDLMTPGTIIPKVLKKCGEPLWEDRVGEISVIRDGGERTLYITQMTYEMSGGYYVLTFEGGVLKDTEYFPY